MDSVQYSSEETVERSFSKSTPELVAIPATIPPVKLSFGYRLGLLVVAAAMVLLPLIYVGLIGLFGYVIYYHAVNHTGMIMAVPGRSRAVVIMALLYITPIVAGIILLLFLIKPLFARPPQQKQSRSLS